MKRELSILGASILLLTHCTSFAPRGKIIYNEDFFGQKPVIINLADMSKDIIPLPQSLQFSVVEASGFLYLFRPSLSYFIWSNDGTYVAFPCLLRENIYLTICVWNSDFLLLENRFPSQYPQSFHMLPWTPAAYPEALIYSISWSPDNKAIIATVRWEAMSPCLIDLGSRKVACGVENSSFWKGFSSEARQVLAGAFELEWSPTEANKMALPLRKNWLSVFEDGKTVVGEEENEYAVGIPTSDYQDGIYLVNIDQKTLSPIWLAPENARVDCRHKVLWTPDGKQLSFTYVDSEGNYKVASVSTDGEVFIPLFDGKDVMAKIKESVPENFREKSPKIFLSSWSSDGRYLLFEVNLAAVPKDGESLNTIDANYLMGGFIYDTKAKQFYKLLEFMPTRYGDQGLRLDWTDEGK